jgi:dUTP pyrophosphatase
VGNEKIQVKVHKLHADAKLPIKSTEYAACFDVYAYETATILPNMVAPVKCGIALEIPIGYFVDIRPRSGMSKFAGIANSPGTVDSDYRGELIILLHLMDNSNQSFKRIKKGDRIAQIRIEKDWETEFVEVHELSKTNRGARGFGSTGI